MGPRKEATDTPAHHNEGPLRCHGACIERWTKAEGAAEGGGWGEEFRRAPHVAHEICLGLHKKIPADHAHPFRGYE